MTIALGIEASANKLGVGIVRDGEILSNPRRTFVAPIGEGNDWQDRQSYKIYRLENTTINFKRERFSPGFMPNETAQHHQENVLIVVSAALREANVTQNDIDVICYTKGESEIPTAENYI